MVMIELYNNLEKNLTPSPSFNFHSLLKELRKTKESAAQTALGTFFQSLEKTLHDNTQFSDLSMLKEDNNIFCRVMTHIFQKTNSEDLIKQIVYKYYKEILKASLLSNLQPIYRHFTISKINPELPKLLPDDNTLTPRIDEKLNHPPVKATLNKKVYSLDKSELTVIDGCATFNEGSIVMMREVSGYGIISSLKYQISVSPSPQQICIDNVANVFCNLESVYYDCNTHTIYVLMESCGRSLADIISNSNETITEPKLLLYTWLKPISIGIKCMQTRRLTHHDIKPANIQINSDNQPKLSGLKFINPAAYNKPAPMYVNKTTSTNVDKTTPTTADKIACVYTHPQILLNTAKESDWMLCDIYSLGITFIECAFALHHPLEYKTLLTNELLYSIFRHTDNNQIPTETTEVELDDIGYVSVRGKWNDSLLIYKTKYKLDDVIPDTNLTVRGIYNAVAKLKTMYPLCMKMIDNKISDIDEIIHEFDTLTTTR